MAGKIRVERGNLETAAALGKRYRKPRGPESAGL